MSRHFHPRADLLSLINELSSGTSPSSNSSHNTPSRRGFSPNADVFEKPTEYILEVELPGLVDKKAVHLEFVDDKTLHLNGKIERTPALPAAAEGQEQEKPRYWVSERTVGEFSRTFSFPTDINTEGVKAGLEYGVLKITVPKRERKQERRRIEID